MKIRALHLAALALLLGLGRPALATLVKEFSLKPPSIIGDTATFEVDLHFESDSGLMLGFFGIDVSDSSSELTLPGGGMDFSAFSFTPNDEALTGDWTQIKYFGDSPGPGTIQFMSISNALPSGEIAYRLGTLSVDLKKAGVAPDSSLFVSIEGSDTQIGDQFGDVYSTFSFDPVAFAPGVQPLVSDLQAVPEPTTWPLAVIGGGFLAEMIRRRRSA